LSVAPIVDLFRGRIHGARNILEHSPSRGFYYYATSFRWPVADSSKLFAAGFLFGVAKFTGGGPRSTQTVTIKGLTSKINLFQSQNFISLPPNNLQRRNKLFC